jgi:hypothetical protein
MPPALPCLFGPMVDVKVINRESKSVPSRSQSSSSSARIVDEHRCESPGA